jgi:hypothetical protein
MDEFREALHREREQVLADVVRKQAGIIGDLLTGYTREWALQESATKAARLQGRADSVPDSQPRGDGAEADSVPSPKGPGRLMSRAEALEIAQETLKRAERERDALRADIMEEVPAPASGYQPWQPWVENGETECAYWRRQYDKTSILLAQMKTDRNGLRADRDALLELLYAICDTGNGTARRMLAIEQGQAELERRKQQEPQS